MKNIVKKYDSYIGNRKIIVDILAVIFGMGTWIGINGSFVQLPLLVEKAPEGWNLPSYMSVATQLANIAPITYAISRKLFSHEKKDKYWISSLLFLGTIAALLMAFFHNHISYINGNPHSVLFLLFVFMTAIVGCTSSVLFFPYMRHYKEIYLISYFIGEGLSGFVPSTLALIQGIGGNPECIKNNQNGNISFEIIYKSPRFSSQLYFSLISFLSFISFCAYLSLINLKICQSEQIHNNKNRKEMITTSIELNNTDEISNSICEDKTNFSIRHIILLILMSVVCAFGNGIFPSIMSYSCLPYGNTAYHLAVSLGNMANPIACFLAIFLPNTSSKSITGLSSICSIFISYLIATSILSPNPPLIGTTLGVIIIVLFWIGAIGLVSYIKLSISTIFRNYSGSWMFYCGATSQLGSALGSLLSFILINYTSLFTASNPCQ